MLLQGEILFTKSVLFVHFAVLQPARVALSSSTVVLIMSRDGLFSSCQSRMSFGGAAFRAAAANGDAKQKYTSPTLM